MRLAEKRMGGNHKEVLVGLVCLIRVDFSNDLEMLRKKGKGNYI